MKFQALIFDLYKTILDVQPPAAGAEERWAGLWSRLLGSAPRISLEEFRRDCDKLVSLEHAAACQSGVAYPEVYWPEILAEVIPELTRLPAPQRLEFEVNQIRLWHSVALMNGAAETLTWLGTQPVRLGLASNCQAYSLVELEECLAAPGLSSRIFDPALRFLSFEHGFSKPNPHAFRFLAAHLKRAGIGPEQVLMIGDREENDIAPARAQGWRTWRLGTPGAEGGGSWTELLESLRAGRS